MKGESKFGEIKNLDVKTIWPGEATHFTPWLSRNLHILSEQIDMELELIGSEENAGGFFADIVAQDIATNRKVIVENQFGGTDHKHLGQILTYASVLDADAIVWIAESIRSEHKTAIDFLNNNLKETLLFYALEISLIQIDDSRPAYVINVVSKPVEKYSVFQQKSDSISESREQYRSFFQSLIDTLREKHKFTNARVGLPQNWYTFASEYSKVFKYSASFSLGNKFRTEIYIDTGDKEENEDLFEFLLEKKGILEDDFGENFEWEKLETKRACRIAAYTAASIDDDSEHLNNVELWAIENLLKMRNIFPKVIHEWIEMKGI